MATSESADYVTLGRLLSRKREQADRDAVEKIVSGELSVRDKIRAIREIDAKGGSGPEKEEAKKEEPDKKEPDKKEPDKKEPDKKEPEREAEENRAGGPLRYRLPVLREILKKPYTRLSYFQYLFGEHHRIAAFGRLTRVLEVTPFPLDVHLSPEVLPFLSGTLKPWAKELSGIVELTLEDSWRYLRKVEYNLLAAFKQLCDKIASTSFHLFNYRDRNLSDKLKSLEALFLVFHCQPHYQQLLLSSLQQVTSRDMRLGGKYEEVADLVSRLLQRDRVTPSLYNVLLGLNILKQRRFFVLEDLLYRDLGELVNTREFACSPDIRKKISETIIEGRRRLSLLREQQQKTRRLKAHLSLRQSGEVSFDSLETFCDWADGSEEGHGLGDDRQNIMGLVPRLFKAFDRTFYPLLNGHVQLEEASRVALFTPDFFQLDFLRIRQVAEKVEILTSSHEQLPLSRFVQLQHSAKGMLGMEAEIMKQVNEGMEVIAEMGKKVETILNNRQEEPGRSSRPLDPMILRSKGFSLPHEDRRILSADVLNRKTVAEALSYLVTVCLTMALLLHYLPVYELLVAEPQMERELRAELETLSRLAGPGSPQEPAGRAPAPAG